MLASVAGERIHAIPGMPPDLANMPPGCAFAPRCYQADSDCSAAAPALATVGATGHVACIKAGAGVP